MKGRRLAVLVACAVLAWAVAPAWCAEETKQDTTQTYQVPAEQKPAEQPAEQAAPQPAAKPASEAPAAQPAGQAASKPEAQSAAQNGVQIEDTAVCQDVVDRAPVGSGDVFAKQIARVYCFCRVVGMEGQGSITHNWYYKGALKASIKLPVRSNNWRTWSSKAMTPEWTGEWMVEILSEEGTPLESIIFFIQ